MKALILAGGLGTRLRTVVNDRPKPMADVLGKPFLWYQLEYLRRFGMTDIVLSVGYLAEQVISYFGSGERFGLRIEYVVETAPLGTGGAIRNAGSLLSPSFVVLNGDTYYTFDLAECARAHRRSSAAISLLAFARQDGSDVGCLAVDDEGRVRGFEEKPESTGPCLASCGVYFMEAAVLNQFPLKTPLSLEKEVLPALIRSGVDIRAIQVNDDFFDIGTPERYQRFCEYVARGRAR